MARTSSTRPLIQHLVRVPARQGETHFGRRQQPQRVDVQIELSVVLHQVHPNLGAVGLDRQVDGTRPGGGPLDVDDPSGNHRHVLAGLVGQHLDHRRHDQIVRALVGAPVPDVIPADLDADRSIQTDGHRFVVQIGEVVGELRGLVPSLQRAKADGNTRKRLVHGWIHRQGRIRQNVVVEHHRELIRAGVADQRAANQVRDSGLLSQEDPAQLDIVGLGIRMGGPVEHQRRQIGCGGRN